MGVGQIVLNILLSEKIRLIKNMPSVLRMRVHWIEESSVKHMWDQVLERFVGK